MAAGVNRVTLIGNLGRDAEVRYTAAGDAVANFTLATTEVWNDRNGQRQERVEWHRCSYWGKPAEAVAQYLVKGKQVYVEGSIHYRKYEDAQGVEKTSTDIKVQRVQLLGSRDSGGGGYQQQQAEQTPESDPGQPELTDDDIPF